MKNIGEIKNGWFAVTNGKFSHIGDSDYDKSIVSDKTVIVDAKSKLVMPGLIDSHTHIVYGGSREHELKKKLEGVPYLDILKSGGGILSTVESTRNSSSETLFNKSFKDLNQMLKYGVTTVESKSGYGLNLETELKQLEVSAKLNEDHPIDLVNTFLGAHAIPNEYKGNKDEYVKVVIEMLKDERTKNLSEFCDIFCEDSVFTYEDSKTILSIAKDEGYKLKIHADEIVDLNGASLAVELGCTSADHLMATSDKGINSLANSETVANLLVSTSFNLNKDYARARKMIDSGCYVSFSTDYNPGSAPSANLPFVMYLAAAKMQVLPEEVLSGVTINAAKAIGRDASIGSIEIGKNADFAIYECDNFEYIFYNFGKSHVQDVYKNGKMVLENGIVIGR